MSDERLDPDLTGCLDFAYSSGPDCVSWLWHVLQRAGVVPDRLDPGAPNYPDHVVTVAALANLTNVIFREYESDYLPTYLGAGRPLLTDAELARPAERAGLDIGEWEDAEDALSAFIVEQRTRSVARAVLAEVGQAALFTGLWGQQCAEMTYPPDEELIDDVTSHPDSEVMLAFERLGECVGAPSAAVR